MDLILHVLIHMGDMDACLFTLSLSRYLAGRSSMALKVQVLLTSGVLMVVILHGVYRPKLGPCMNPMMVHCETVDSWTR